jgi:formate dehydrogenase major subunit
MISINLNGSKINTTEGKTILEVAKENGIEIPTLCHDEELSPFGSCWVCAVQIVGRRGFVTACGTEVSDGMEIITESSEVRAARKMALELLLSDHYADCEAPCKLACPDRVDVQTYVSLIANGEYHEAVKVIKETLPMPLSIGRVCPAFCEDECRRSLVEDPLAIRQLKRYCADHDIFDRWQYTPPKMPKKNKSVAIVGGGPSGLTCGYYLSNNGYDVKVYEAAPQAGGWLRYGIPEYRLPKKILDKEIELMCKNGMSIQTGVNVGKDITLKQLYEDFDALYLAIGAQKAVPMKVKGDDLKGCYLGVDYLKAVALGKKVSLGKKVAVVGGGNTAIDCARTARRSGADVTLVYRRTRKEMPAEAYEVDAAEEEGVKFHFLTNPVEYIGAKNKLKTIKLEKMKLGEPDDSGRRRPEPTGEFFTEAYTSVIAAISQIPDVDFLTEDANRLGKEGLKLTRWLTAEVDEQTMFTGIDRVFAGGDFQRGPATAIEAIADGRLAAEAIDRYLSGKMMMDISNIFTSQKAKKIDEIDPTEYEQYEKIAKLKMPELDAEARIKSHDEVELGFSDDDAKIEAERCLECGCQVNTHCDLRDYATDYKIDVELFMGDKNRHPIDESHPFILRDANKCIKCGRCVRICAEVQGPGVLGYIYRGFVTYVAPELGESLTKTECEACGKCIEVCPVGALVPRNLNYKLNPHQTDRITQNCGLCSNGCEIDINIQSGRITTITPAENSKYQRDLCFHGKFGWQVFDNFNRLKKPLLKHETMKNWDKFLECWQEFKTNKEMNSYLKEKLDQADSKHIYISGDVTNEEMLLMKTIASSMGAEISSLSYYRSFVEKFYNTKLLPKNQEDIEKAETIVLVGDVNHTLKIKARQAQRNGKKLVIISKDKKEFNKYADVLLNEDPINDTLERILDYYNDEDEIASEEVMEERPSPIELDLPEKTLFIYNKDEFSEETMWNLWMLGAIVCDFETGSGIWPTTSINNFIGLLKNKIKPGIPKLSDFVVLYGELPCEEQKKRIRNSQFILSFTTHLDELDPAHMVFPKPSYLEIKGTAFANDGQKLDFKNPTTSRSFRKILSLFYDLELINKEQKSEEYWRKQAEHIAEFENNPLSSLELVDSLSSMDKVDFSKPKIRSIHKNLINKLKKMAKSNGEKNKDI